MSVVRTTYIIRKEDLRTGEQNIRECLVDRTKTTKKSTPTERNRTKEDDMTKTVVPKKKGPTTRKKKTDGQNEEQKTKTTAIKSLNLILENGSGKDTGKMKVIEDEKVVLGNR